MNPRTDDALCCKDTPLTLPVMRSAQEFVAQDGVQEGTLLALPVKKTAKEWAEELGLKWETVRKRRYRGWSWREALDPKLRRSPFNDSGLR